MTKVIFSLLLKKKKRFFFHFTDLTLGKCYLVDLIAYSISIGLCIN